MISNETAPSLQQEPEEVPINPEWLSAVNPRKEPFFPQIGDEVVYCKLGICFYQY